MASNHARGSNRPIGGRRVEIDNNSEFAISFESLEQLRPWWRMRLWRQEPSAIPLGNLFPMAATVRTSSRLAQTLYAKLAPGQCDPANSKPEQHSGTASIRNTGNIGVIKVGRRKPTDGLTAHARNSELPYLVV